MAGGPLPGGGAPHNPFASRHVEPGAVPFFARESAAAIFQAFLEAGARGQLVGPHGSGKSTLLAHLAECARAAGWEALEAAPETLPGRRDLGPRTLLLLDGAEQLAPRAWRRLQAAGERAGAGLLVTTHRDLGLPTLRAAGVDLETARRVVTHLLREEAFPVPPDEELAHLLEQHAGNLREVLFALYDRYEEWVRQREA